MKETILKST